MPGLVNLHTHLPMTLLRGLAENVDLQGFLRIVCGLTEGAVMDRTRSASALSWAPWNRCWPG